MKNRNYIEKWIYDRVFYSKPIFQLCLTILISVGGSSFAQANNSVLQKTNNKPIVLNSKGEKLTEAIKKLEQSTDFLFSYNPNELNKYKVKNNITSNSINDVLNSIFKDQPLEYKS